MRIAAILQQLRDIQHDNAPQLEYLLYRNEFPKEGYRRPVPKDVAMIFNEQRYPGARQLGIELADSLSSFYKQADVGGFLRRNTFFYKGALKEAKQYIDADKFSYMEKWYGKQFSGYEIYLMPGMPIPPGDDNYRAFGPMLISPAGEVAAMVFSSSVQLPLLKDLKAYRKFGFDNAEVTRFLTTHEMGHSFVNPVINVMRTDLVKDTALFTPALAKELEKSYVGNWETCLVEHLVRLGEIRIAKLMGDEKEESRLRNMHLENGFVLLPMLERMMEHYEANRKRYQSFEQFLPEVFKTLHDLKPAEIDRLLTKR